MYQTDTRDIEAAVITRLSVEGEAHYEDIVGDWTFTHNALMRLIDAGRVERVGADRYRLSQVEMDRMQEARIVEVNIEGIGMVKVYDAWSMGKTPFLQLKVESCYVADCKRRGRWKTRVLPRIECGTGNSASLQSAL